MFRQNTLTLLLAFLVAATGLTGCAGDATETQNVEGMSLLTAISLGSMKRAVYFKTDDGRDTTAYMTVTSSLYPLTIDQVGHRVFNADSLPRHTFVDKVTLSTLNAQGTATVKSLATGTDTLLTPTDSLDFRQQRVLTIHGYDGTSTTSYTIDIRVHKEDGDSMRWTRTTAGAATDGFGFLYAMTAQCKGDSLLVWAMGTPEGSDDSGVYCLWTSAANPEAWHSVRTSGASLFNDKVALHRDMLYAQSETHLIKSADGIAWTEVAPLTMAAGAQSRRMLVGATTRSLYAYGIDEGCILRSTDGGLTWTKDKVSGTLPEGIQWESASLTRPSKSNPNMEEIFVLGESSNTPKPTLYTLSRQEMVKAEDEGVADFQWTAYRNAEGSPYNLPDNQGYKSVLSYDGALLCISQDAGSRAYSARMSQDGGRVWSAGTVTLPELNAQTDFIATVDARNFIWLIGHDCKTLWRGRLNRLGWSPEQQVFYNTRRQGKTIGD